MNSEKHNRKNPLIIPFITCVVFTGIHLSVLYLLLYLDHHFILSETLLSIIAIPVGLINCAAFFTSFSRLKGLTKTGILYFVFIVLNFVWYIVISLDLYSQAGALTN